MGNNNPKHKVSELYTEQVDNKHKQVKFDEINKNSSYSLFGKSFISTSSQQSVCSVSRPWSRVSRRRWKESTLTLPYESSKTAWPVSQLEAYFLPVFPVNSSSFEDRYKSIEEVASGAFGKVYKVYNIEDKNYYALKVLSKSRVIKENAINQVKEEVEIQSTCGHYNFIVNSPSHWQTRKKLFIVSDFFDGGELYKLLETHNKLPIELVQLYVFQLASALDFLHNAGVIYRDLKPENILLDHNENCHITDFGLSKWLSYGNKTKTFCGTPRYMAPEIKSMQPYGHACDWWSLGVTACLMLTGKFPTMTLDVLDEATGHAEHKMTISLPDDVELDVACRDLLLRLLEVDPVRRLRSIRTLQTIAFYKSYNFADVKCKKINGIDIARKYYLDRLVTEEDTFHLAGVGHMVGAGIYVLAGTVTKEIAGPGIILSFLLAGLASLLSALCYAEFGTRVPKAGSAYVYTYISIGEFWAFVIGWNILLEHMIGAASVARAWSGYVDSLFGGFISDTTISLTGELHEQLLGKYPDILAFAVCIVYALLLGIGVKGSSIVNSFLTLVNLSVMTLVIVMGFYYSNEENWTSQEGGFLPYGFRGVIAGAATCFYAFVGFDSIATSGEEAKNPSFSIPMATVISMGIVTLGYILVCAALTLLVPYCDINPTAALPEAFSKVGMHWIKYVVSLGAICGMTTTLFGSLFSLPRCMYAMAVDGLLFSFLGDINSKTQVPLTNLIISGLLTSIIALLFDLEKLVEFMSIGTLLAYTIVSASVIILRYKPIMVISKSALTPNSEMSGSTSEPTTPNSETICLTGTLRPKYSWLRPLLRDCEPGCAVTTAVFVYIIFSGALCVLVQVYSSDLWSGTWWTIALIVFFVFVMGACILIITAHYQSTERLRFKVPLVPLLPALSILCNLEFIVHLNVLTWLRFFVWMIIGILIYFLYGIHHSKEGDLTSTYSMLMTSSEAVKSKFGSTMKTNIQGALTRRKSSSSDKNAILNDVDDEGA